MALIDSVIEKIRALPPERQQRVLEFLQSLEEPRNGDIARRRQVSVWDEISTLGRELEALPTELPDDLARNHDHYLHGMPKR